MESSQLIKKLLLHQRYWSIKVLIIEKEESRNFKYGQGQIQKLTLMDVEGSRIYALMFNDIIDKFKEILQKGKTYVISNGEVKDTNKNFYNVNDSFEIILNNLTQISQVDDDIIFPSNINLSSIEKIKKHPNIPADLLLLVVKVGETRMIYRQKDGAKIIKRDLQVIGLRSELLTFTLWESLATTEGKHLEEIKHTHPIILAKAIVGKNYNGFTLSSTSSTNIELNPNFQESIEIREWFNDNKFTSTTAISEEDFITDLVKVNTTKLSSGETKYYNTRVTIKAVKDEANLWYNACNICKSKVIITEDSAECAKCSSSNAKFSLRYLVKLQVEDATATAIITMFDEEANEIFTMSASDLQKIKETNKSGYNTIVNNVIGCSRIFSIKAQHKIYRDQPFESLTVEMIKNDIGESSSTISKKIKLEED